MNLVLPDVQPLFQPDASGICGQTCVAMAAGVSIEQAVRACGRSTMREEGTVASELIAGLRKLGLKAAQPLYYKSKGRRKLMHLPERAIMGIHLRIRPSAGHWVLLWDGYVYDPGIGWPMPLYAYETFIITRAASRRFFGKLKGESLYAYWDCVISIRGKK